jgi:hypothetical protein
MVIRRGTSLATQLTLVIMLNQHHRFQRSRISIIMERERIC